MYLAAQGDRWRFKEAPALSCVFKFSSARAVRAPSVPPPWSRAEHVPGFESSAGTKDQVDRWSGGRAPMIAE